ncbi:type VI secretion system amidase immunity protein Tai4 [Pseudomonas syringae]|nr:type VI secretion system amidase immunity protein Tai4 [Pseudomonas syringae]MCQ3029401.1 type VI secretion system amidase immunity protein Tai4 [Pseudomonas syringae]MDG6398832.1 type VI secretion system amidase immunity protein Tai4 [Pseudomonas quasicaspiana]
MRRFLGFLSFMLTASLAFATDRPSSPQSIEQNYGQNYKDMVLATCVANAYKGDKNAATDAGSSVSALRDWTYYDLEKSPDEVNALVNSYLDRNYKNPLVEAEVKGVRFDFLKCLDLYHSKELDVLAKKVVINPGHTYRQDNP